MSYPAYAETKASGVEWLGDLPREWEVMRLKHVASVALSNVDKKSVEGQESVLLCNYTDVYYNSEITSALNFMEATAPQDQIKRFQLRVGDVLITKDSETPDDIAVPAVVAEELDGVLCGYHLALLRPSKSVDGGYLRYAIASPPFRDHFRAVAHGVTRFGIALDDIGTALAFLPPLTEQQQIAAFLDRKTAELDAVLRLKERQLQLLAEKRQALISQAVTRGLDPTAPLKPSGIPWLGDVPGHWEIEKIAWLFGIIGSGTTPSSGDESFYDGEFPWVNTGELNDDVILETKKSVTAKAMHNLSTLTLFPVDTLLIALYGATIGNLGILGIPATTNQACCALADPKGISIEFAFYWFIGNRRHIVAMAYGGGQPNISQELVKQLRIALPPPDEQKAIVAQLKQETAYIDGITQTTETQIEKVREYRQALISAAVTGKIDVRGEAGVPT